MNYYLVLRVTFCKFRELVNRDNISVPSQFCHRDLSSQNLNGPETLGNCGKFRVFNTLVWNNGRAQQITVITPSAVVTYFCLSLATIKFRKHHF